MWSGLLFVEAGTADACFRRNKIIEELVSTLLSSSRTSRCRYDELLLYPITPRTTTSENVPEGVFSSENTGRGVPEGEITLFRLQRSKCRQIQGQSL